VINFDGSAAKASLQNLMKGGRFSWQLTGRQPLLGARGDYFSSGGILGRLQVAVTKEVEFFLLDSDFRKSKRTPPAKHCH
jgi:hypothetical protein